MPRIRRCLVAATTVVCAITLSGGSALAAQHHPTAPDISVTKVEGHLQALQAIADANGGNRALGTSGYQASVDYVKKQLDAAGFTTSLQQFDFEGKKSVNLIADWGKARPGQKVVMAGGHLDSVDTGPGINDNGSAVGAVLETALAVAQRNFCPADHLRFAFWGAEEETFIGSTYYVEHLPATELRKITAYLNYDMIASPNPGYFSYNQNPDIDALFKQFFRTKGIETEPATALNGRSDHEPFVHKGVRVGGMFTGSAEVKTGEQARKWGGTPNEVMDKCYHLACDTPANINAKALDLNSDAMAAVVWKLSS